MKIKIVIPHHEVDLPEHLRDMGIRPGDMFDASPAPETRHGAVRFQVLVDDEVEVCTVMEKNYKRVS